MKTCKAPAELGLAGCLLCLLGAPKGAAASPGTSWRMPQAEGFPRTMLFTAHHGAARVGKPTLASARRDFFFSSRPQESLGWTDTPGLRLLLPGAPGLCPAPWLLELLCETISLPIPNSRIRPSVCISK